MKTTQTSANHKGSAFFAGVKGVVRVILTAAGWITLVCSTALAGFFSGWIFLAVSRLGRAPQEKVTMIVAVLLAIAGVSGLLLARFASSARNVGRVAGAILAAILAVWIGWSVTNPAPALFLAREVGWGDSTVKDFERFPQRPIANAGPAFQFKQNPPPGPLPAVPYRSEGVWKSLGFEDFLRSTQTTSFIAIKDDAILYEGYFNGYDRASIVTSFSVAKSFTSTLIGIAIREGFIGSVNDRMIAYLPELSGKGFDTVTIRDLLMMSAGIQYRMDDEYPALEELSQFTDDGMAYSYPDLRRLALQIQPDGKAPGTEFNYNNYHPLLLGIILERTTGRTVSEYLQEKIWKPLGMEFPASWSLDSEECGFEQMQSGINARAIDFAKFGRLFLRNGDWDGTRILSEEWVAEATAPEPDDRRTWRSYADWQAANGYYKYLWWGKLRADGGYDYMAQGHLGQWIFVSPQAKAIIVRFGLDEGGVDSWADVMQNLAASLP